MKDIFWTSYVCPIYVLKSVFWISYVFPGYVLCPGDILPYSEKTNIYGLLPNKYSLLACKWKNSLFRSFLRSAVLIRLNLSSCFYFRQEFNIAWKVSVIGVFRVHIFQHSDWISAKAGKYGQKNSEYGHFLRSERFLNTFILTYLYPKISLSIYPYFD